MFHWTGAKYDWIFGFRISVLWGETLFELFHCILQVEIKTVKLYSLVMELLWENQVLLISTVFHWIGGKYAWIFGFHISVF